MCCNGCGSQRMTVSAAGCHLPSCLRQVLFCFPRCCVRHRSWALHRCPPRHRRSMVRTGSQCHSPRESELRFSPLGVSTALTKPAPGLFIICPVCSPASSLALLVSFTASHPPAWEIPPVFTWFLRQKSDATFLCQENPTPQAQDPTPPTPSHTCALTRCFSLQQLSQLRNPLFACLFA